MGPKMIVCGVDCSDMEMLAARVSLFGKTLPVGKEAAERLVPLDSVNRRYLRKRSTARLVRLLGNAFWTQPHRAALIFDVLNRRVEKKVRRSVFAQGDQLTA